MFDSWNHKQIVSFPTCCSSQSACVCAPTCVLATPVQSAKRLQAATVHDLRMWCPPAAIKRFRSEALPAPTSLWMAMTHPTRIVLHVPWLFLLFLSLRRYSAVALYCFCGRCQHHFLAHFRLKLVYSLHLPVCLSPIHLLTGTTQENAGVVPAALPLFFPFLHLSEFFFLPVIRSPFFVTL